MLAETLEEATFAGLPEDSTSAAISKEINLDADGAQAGTSNADTVVKEAAAAKEAEKTAADKAAADKTAADQLVNPNLAGNEAAAATVKVDDPEEKKPAGMTDKAWISWKSKNQEIKEAKQKITEAETRAKDFETKYNESQKLATDLESAKKELEVVKQKLAEYDSEISVTRVEATPQFKQAVTAPLAEINSSVAEIAARYEVPSETLLRAIQEPDHGKRTDALEDAITDFKRPDQLEIVTVAKEYHRVQKIAAEMRQDAGKRLEQMTTEQKLADERMSAQNISEYRSATTAAWNNLQQLVPVIRKVEGNDKWNAYLDSKQREIEALDVNNLPLDTVARMAAAEKAMPEVMTALKHFQSEAEKQKARADAAEAKNKEYLATAPGAGAGAHGKNGGDSTQRNGSFEDSVFGD